MQLPLPRRTLTLFLLVVTSFSVFAADSMPANKPVLEPLYGLTFNPVGATIRVVSNGCTSSRDFRILLRSKTSADFNLDYMRIIRMLPDRCRARPRVISLTLKMNRIPTHAIHVENPFRIYQ